MKNNTTKIIAAIITILAIVGVAAYALDANKSKDQIAKDTFSKSSDYTKTANDSRAAIDEMKAQETMAKRKMPTSSLSTISSFSETTKNEVDIVIKKSEPISKIETGIKESDTMSNDIMNKSAEVSSPTGIYSQYSVNNLAQNSTGINLIFFCSPSNSSCKAIENEITNNLDKLPENFQILKADFDTATALKQKYGITNEATFVKVDKDGSKIGEVFKAFEQTKLVDIVTFGQK